MTELTEFFSDAKHLFEKNYKVDKKEIIYHRFFPSNLKTLCKQEFFDELPEKICEADFIELLQYKNTSADYVNIDYLLYYYNTKCDSNYMPIFTNKFTYNNNTNVQTFYIYAIIKNLQSHPIFKNYPELLKFSFNKNLEINLLSDDKAFKYDIVFDNINVAVYIDEGYDKVKNINYYRYHKNTQKDAIGKLLGMVVFRIKAFEIVCISDIKKYLFCNYYNIFDKDFKFPIKDIKTKYGINWSMDLLNCVIYKCLDINLPHSLKKYYTNFVNKYNNHNEIINYLTDMIIPVIDKKINDKIITMMTDSEYLKNKIKELNIVIFHALLMHDKFRKDYISMIFKENIIDNLTIELENVNNCINTDIDNIHDSMREYLLCKNIARNVLENDNIRSIIEYYTSIENIYQSILEKITLHNERIISSEDNFNLYIPRIKEHYKSNYDFILRKIKNLNYFSEIDYNIIKNSFDILYEIEDLKNISIPIAKKEIIFDEDYDKIIRTDILERYKDLNSKFEKLCIGIKYNYKVIDLL